MVRIDGPDGKLADYEIKYMLGVTPQEDTHRPVLLTQPTYYADGQQRDEDYTWGSFRQSKMYRNGVTCLDCHEPRAAIILKRAVSMCCRPFVLS